MIVNIILFLIGTAVHTATKYWDIWTSRGLEPVGLREGNKLFRDENGWFSEKKAWIGVGLITALFTGWFVVTAIFSGENDTWQPWYSVIGYTISAGMSAFHGYRNLQKIAYQKELIAKGIKPNPNDLSGIMN